MILQWAWEELALIQSQAWVCDIDGRGLWRYQKGEGSVCLLDTWCILKAVLKQLPNALVNQVVQKYF